MIRGRLAPSPTGALHLGNARTFLLAWLSIRSQGGQVVLRIEDLDGPRVKPETVAQLIGDLRWLGLDWDEGPATKPLAAPRSSGGEPADAPPSRSDRRLSDHRPPDHRPPDYRLLISRPSDAVPPTSPNIVAPDTAFSDTASLEERGDYGPYVQTRRLAWYRAAWERLAESGRVYPCRCSRTDIERAASAPHVGDEGPPYPGTCRPERRIADPGDRPPAWRFRVPDGEAAIVRFQDGLKGPVAADVAATSGDFVVWKGSGTAAYQLAVVVDDAAMAITEVVRGDDLLSSTPRQLLLYDALGLRPPRFWHVPLVVGLDGRRLAKRHGDTRISWFRDAGVPAERLVGWLAWQSGLVAAGTACQPADLIDRFEWSKVPGERIVCDRDAVCRSLV